MSKQQIKPQNLQQKEGASAQDKSFKYFLHNAIIISVLGLALALVYNMNSNRGELRSLYNEFDDLKEKGDKAGMNSVYEQIKAIEIDTPYYKMLTLGYYDNIHSLGAISKQIEELRASVNNGNKEGPVTREDKLAYKVAVFPLLQYVNENTPKNAVILLPPTDSLAYTSKWNYLYDPIWVEYFIYPRLCLTTGREADHPDLAKRITHVLIVKGIGYDKLKYDVPVEKREKVAVLPINPPDTLQTR